MKTEISIYCDGGARGNPGPAASAFIVVKKGRVVHKGSKYLGETTNNVAEYQSALMALDWLDKRGNGDLEEGIVVNLDSELVTNQMSGKYKVKNQRLKGLFLKAKSIESRLPFKVFYKWSPRSNNRLADYLVNEELDKNS
ncbi:MAG: ribonuclease HI family protein [Patescibacteria group bacterium]|jgi:ribonuclease HI